MVSREKASRNGHLNPSIPLSQTARTTRLAANLIIFNSFAREFKEDYGKKTIFRFSILAPRLLIHYLTDFISHCRQRRGTGPHVQIDTVDNHAQPKRENLEDENEQRSQGQQVGA